MPDSVWIRLGEALARRRVEIDPKYRNLSLFARERGLNERLVSDIEHARRKGYRNGTRHALEIAYGLDAGRLGRFVAGEVGDLGQYPPPGPGGGLPDDDPVLEYVRSLPGLTPGVRERLEYVARAPGDPGWRFTLVGAALALMQADQPQTRSA